MENRTHYVPYQSQDAKNVENTPIVKNVKTVESPGSNSGCFELKNDNVQNIEFDPKTQSKKPRTFACKKENLGSSNCKSNALNNNTMQSSITFSQANTVDHKACNFTEEKGEGAVKNPPLNNREHIQFGVSGTFMSILLFFRTVINSLRFKVVEPSVLFWASGFCHLHPSSLARMEGPCAFVRWRRCVMAPVFSSEIFVKVYLSLQRTVSMFRTAENEQQRMYEQCEI